MTDLIMTREFRVDDVWIYKKGARKSGVYTTLVRFDMTPIYEVSGRMIKHYYGWTPVEDFNEMVHNKYGRRVRVWSIFWKTIKDPQIIIKENQNDKA